MAGNTGKCPSCGREVHIPPPRSHYKQCLLTAGEALQKAYELRGNGEGDKVGARIQLAEKQVREVLESPCLAWLPPGYEVMALSLLGSRYEYDGKNAQAIDAYEKSVALRRSKGVTDNESGDADALANLYDDAIERLVSTGQRDNAETVISKLNDLIAHYRRVDGFQEEKHESAVLLARTRLQEQTSPAAARPVSTMASPKATASTEADKIRFKCAGCGKALNVPVDKAGKTGKCPSCGAAITIPMATSPISAPVATETMHSPLASTEAQSAAGTWKCPACAEEIKKDAQKCRFCGMVLTKAARMGYPAFYENVAKRGLSSTWLTFDYADHLFPDEAGIDNCCLSASSPLLSLFDNREDEKAKVLRLGGGIVQAMRKRLEDIPADSQEALVLRATSKYLWMIRDFARPGDSINNSETLENYARYFAELKQTLSPLESEARQELEGQLDDAVRVCQDKLSELQFKAREESEAQAATLLSNSTDAFGDLPKELRLDLGRKSGLLGIAGSLVELELVLIPAGKFMMESHVDGQQSRRAVTISQPYYMGKYPVTQEQYEKVMGQNPSAFRGGRNPADRVSWNDASDFCRRLSRLTGRTARLPTMAEWEFACRARTTTRFHSGDSDSDLSRAGWYEGNSGGTTHPVGQKAPNAWGLYDMHGNVYEWCQDVLGGQDYRGSMPVTDPKGLTFDDLEAYSLRGGCWGSNANECQSGEGMECERNTRNNITGLRVVVDQGLQNRADAAVDHLGTDSVPEEQHHTQNATPLSSGLRREEPPGGVAESPPGGADSDGVPSDFSFRRDFRRIQWGLTLQVNCLRAAAAGIVWCIVLLLMFHSSGQPGWWKGPLSMLALPFVYPVFLLPIGMLFELLREKQLPRFIWWMYYGLIVMIMAGDPLVFVAQKLYPPLVPVRRFSVVNFTMAFWVFA
jgi:formylglycine-generating enzyme required for sulfatase activity/predicted RNA-binding Zn-ribbon protein involved in translation (DUF1610 family)